MSSSYNPEIFKGVDRHLGLPSFGLRVHSYDRLTYEANVRPLRRPDLSIIEDRRFSLAGLVHHGAEIQAANKAKLDSSDTVAVVLDGRVSIYNQGFLGDLVEASRLVTALRQADKRVKIISSHTDIFDGSSDQGVSVAPIPADLPSGNEMPWQPRLLEYVGKVADGSPVMFPMNAKMPLLLSVNPDGEIADKTRIDELNRFLSQKETQVGIQPERWWRRGIHQLQALQIIADLTGIPGALEWDRFPDAYLHPNKRAQRSVDKVINIYNCFFKGASSDKVPLLVHPGVATNGRKIELKAFLESRWKKVLEEVKNEGLPIKSVNVLKPVDAQQGAMASRLATYAHELGFKTTALPEQKLRAKYGWSLGSFIAFLQELSHRQGIILGCDSMPAGHAGPAVDVPAVVLASPSYNPGFYCPPKDALVVMPKIVDDRGFTKDINPHHVVEAIRDMSEKVLSR